MTKHLGKVTIYKKYYLESEVYEGLVPDGDIWQTEHTNVDAHEAVQILTREGLFFNATGGQWAADPDGSHCVNYATGEMCEASGHLKGFPDRLAEAIKAKVDQLPKGARARD